MREIELEIDSKSFKEKLGIKDVDITPILDSINLLRKELNKTPNNDNTEILNILNSIESKKIDNSDIITAINNMASKIVIPESNKDLILRFDKFVEALNSQGLFRPNYNSYNPQLRNKSEEVINPATEEKQDDIITAIQTISGSANYATRVDDTSTLNVTYVGDAEIGSATSSAVWRIQKIDKSSGVVITWADGDDSFNNIWDNRTSLTYS